MRNKEMLTRISFAVGTSIICFIFSVTFLSAVGFILHISISPLWVILSTVLSLIYLLIVLKKNTRKVKIIALVLLMLSVLLSLLLSRVFVDVSYDGNTYHKTAIGQLKDGWNPVYETIESFNATNSNSSSRLPGNPPGKISLWVNHYTKGTWIYGANIYKATGNIIYSKSLNPLLIIAVLFVAFSFLLFWLDSKKAIIVSALLAFNPVALYQIFTNYTDGALGNLIIILLILMTMFVTRAKNKGVGINLILINVVIVIALLANIKFTGLAYAGIYSVLYLGYVLISKNYTKPELIKLLSAGLLSLILAVVIIGSSSYVKNLFLTGSPLYPLMGNNQVDIITYNEPVDFHDKNQLYKFIESHFSKSKNLNEAAQESPTIKIPFTIHPGEINASSGYDTRIGGYGVLFSGISLLTVLAFIFISLRIKKYSSTNIFLVLIPVIGTATLAVVVEGSWWARYLPQLYALPILCAIVLFYLRHKLVAYALLALLFVNTTLGVPSLISNNQSSSTIIAYGLAQANGLCTKDTKAVIPVFAGFSYNILDSCSEISITYNESVLENIPLNTRFTVGRYATMFAEE